MSPVARPNPVSNCPLTAAWAAVGGKWKLTIIYWLAERPRHFAGLRRQLDSVSEGISAKVLAQQLHELIADGIVERKRTGTPPAPVIYSLTDYGRSVLPMLDLVRLWGKAHIERVRADQPEGSSHSLNCLTAVVPSRAALAAPELK
ncbi:MAG TPA: helix-turn-helix domain-containing protein [Myxococcales bacterium]|nr:helix-turn-helix domain-containing protein [Myxococcales bacterium]